MLTEPGIAKAEAKQRAAALAELGRIYLAAEVPPELQQTQEQHMQEALKKLQEMMEGMPADAAAADDETAPPPAGAAASNSR